ncbi:wsv495 [White spot syndrome virus]|uniref:Wsv495 n=2 Tax=White spot syndrome virus TaxID=92652 RepID=Q8VAD0_WSSVS|nr:wsv495 [Shrimp white spot syndrome virus]AAL33496.1 wsv495 [Shrimp white spot syndrome virus]BDX26960.1 MAG: hypothetical protein [White spot syndrome virus]BDX27129.1 MAG: hypothetical protein [White spot syndrome virus]
MFRSFFGLLVYHGWDVDGLMNTFGLLEFVTQNFINQLEMYLDKDPGEILYHAEYLMNTLRNLREIEKEPIRDLGWIKYRANYRGFS